MQNIKMKRHLFKCAVRKISATSVGSVRSCRDQATNVQSFLRNLMLYSELLFISYLSRNLPLHSWSVSQRLQEPSPSKTCGLLSRYWIISGSVYICIHVEYMKITIKYFVFLLNAIKIYFHWDYWHCPDLFTHIQSASSSPTGYI